MTSRGRGYGSNDWDENSNQELSQYGDEERLQRTIITIWGCWTVSPQQPHIEIDVIQGKYVLRIHVQFDHTRLYVTNLAKGLSDQGLKEVFSKYGTLEEAHVSKDPLKRYALFKYETAGEAKIAMVKLNKTEPLFLNISIAKTSAYHQQQHRRYSYDNSYYEKSKASNNQDKPNVNGYNERSNERPRRNREDSASISSRGRRSRATDEQNSGDSVKEKVEEELGLDRNLHMELESLKLEQLEIKKEQLKIKEEELVCKHRLLLLQSDKKGTTSSAQTSGSNRCILPDGRIVVRATEKCHDNDASFTTGAGDSNDTSCSCKNTNWPRNDETDTSAPSTCVLCSDDRKTPQDRGSKQQSQPSSKPVSKSTVTVSKSKQSDHSKVSESVSRRSDATNKKLDAKKCACKVKSDLTCDLKFRDFYADSDDEADETNRLIQLRNSDYLDIVEDKLKLVVALAGYPKSKIRLREMELFQRCLNDIIDMQTKACLLRKVPAFLDYYLNRGAIVCVCKDMETRDWMVRISPGLQERMCTNLVLLNAKVKRLCLAVLKIPRSCWPATAQDAFKLLQYFNPALKTKMWKIYAQKIVNDVECTSFLIDRVSGEIIRGPSFKNVIDYNQMEFELTGYTEIYYECLLSTIEEDLSSVASRVKLLEEIKSAETTPRISSTISIEPKPENKKEIKDKEKTEVINIEENKIEEETDLKKLLEDSLDKGVLQKMKDIQYIGENDEILVWSDEAGYNDTEKVDSEKPAYTENETCTSLIATTEQTESVIGSTDNLLTKSSTLNIDSNRGIAYHRRTNYLHIENELKVAITMEGYPQNKLEGTHIRRLKHLFKEYLHRDMKSQRFGNLIIPKFQDIYLSNGAVIYICDSLETKDYLTEVLPKFINSTGLKLTFKDMKDLVRYTRVVMRLPKDFAHVESVEIIMKLREKYPGLKPDCWKYYSDVAGKQKRQFGVDPESLEVIKSPGFDPVYEGETLTFRIIDRQKRDVSSEKSKTEDGDEEFKKQRDLVARNMYSPINPEIANAPLTRIRTNHYSNLIADDLKLYLGPSSYPESRIEEVQFHLIKRTFEDLVLDGLDNGTLTDSTVPKFHDMYLFDGVIFIICQSIDSKYWIEKNVAFVNDKLKICLKSTEFRGAVGIVSMVVKTTRHTDEIIDILQANNPRLRTKYWRKISTVRSSTKIDVVMQIDKLSAQVIMDSTFNKQIDNEPVIFKLGHLQSLIKPKASLEELTKAYTLKLEKKLNKANECRKVKKDVINENKSNSPKKSDPALEQNTTEPESPKRYKELQVPDNVQTKIILKVPVNILPENQDDLNIIFDILEDKNPGLNTEIWQVYSESEYPSNGKFIIYVDKQSLSVIKRKSFDSSVVGEKLKFFF